MSRTRRYAPVVVAALLLLAGCGGGGSATPTGMPTEAATPTATATATPEPTLETISYPEGLSRDGYENATRALATFREGLASGPSYAVRMDVESGTTTQTLRSRTAPDERRVYARTERNGNLSYELYYENRTQYIRNAETDPARYGTTNATFEGAILGLNGGDFLTIITRLNLSAAGVAREDGRTVVTYEVVGTRSGSDVEDATGQIRMTTEGRLVGFEYTVATSDGQLTVRWRRTAVGETTVPRPDWLSQTGG